MEKEWSYKPDLDTVGKLDSLSLYCFAVVLTFMVSVPLKQISGKTFSEWVGHFHSKLRGDWLCRCYHPSDIWCERGRGIFIYNF